METTFKKSLERITKFQEQSRFYLLERAALISLMGKDTEEYDEQLTLLGVELFMLLLLTSEFVIIAEEFEEYELCSTIINKSKKVFSQTSKMLDNTLNDDVIEESFNKFIQDIKNN